MDKNLLSRKYTEFENMEFIKGEITINYKPLGTDFLNGAIEVIKGKEKRIFPFKDYFIFHGNNWREVISNNKTKNEKIKFANFWLDEYSQNYEEYINADCDVEKYFLNIIENQIKPIIRALELEKDPKSKHKTIKTKPPEEFSDLFNDISIYKRLMEIFVKKGLVQSNTYIWTDHGKSNKSYLASLIKHLHTKGYYKIMPTNKEIEIICKNSFKHIVAIDTIKRAKSDNFDFSYIEPASTL